MIISYYFYLPKSESAVVPTLTGWVFTWTYKGKTHVKEELLKGAHQNNYIKNHLLAHT